MAMLMRGILLLPRSEVDVRILNRGLIRETSFPLHFLPHSTSKQVSKISPFTMDSAHQLSYVDAISKCRRRYPDLLHLDNFLKSYRSQQGQAAVLEFKKGKVKRTNFSDADDLRGYFQRSPTDPCRHRLYLLEDLSRPYVEVFGSHFRINLHLFASQERANWISRDNPSLGLTYRLPSAEIQDSIFTLRYYELGSFLGEGDLHLGVMTSDSNIFRIIDRDRFAGDRVFSIKRNASFWSRANDEGWDGKFLAFY